MRATITDTLSRKLPARKLEIRDTKLVGFVIRCRASGYHSYLMSIGRGRTVTLGRAGEVGKAAGAISAAVARANAKQLASAADKEAARLRGEDPTLTLGEAQVQARATAVAARRERRRGAVTLGAFLAEVYTPWVVEHRKTGGETLARLNAVFADLLATPLAGLSAFAIERWRSARLKGGVTPATTNRDLAALRGALTKAVEWGRLASSPMKAVKVAKVDAIGLCRYLSEAENVRLRDALAARDDQRRAERARANAHRRARGYDLFPEFGRYTDHLTPVVLLALNTGLRRGELLALRWRDIDLAGPLLTVRGADAKSGVSRWIPLNPEAVAVLRAWRPAGVDLDAPVFPGAEGEPLKELKGAWLALMRAAKIERFRLHDLRHDFASRLVQAGVDLNTVRDLLGHADLKMTLRYAHLAPEQKAAAVAKLVRA